jgi:hypothetical protein
MIVESLAQQKEFHALPNQFGIGPTIRQALMRGWKN